MQCAVVLIVKDFAALNEQYGLDYAFARLAAAGLSQPFHVLIAEGFDNVPPAFVERWRADRIEVSDCSGIVDSLVSENPWLAAISDNPVYRVTLLRHLILERKFPGEGVLSVDADIVWRDDPYALFGGWTGGHFALGGSGFLTYAKDRSWFDAYREGLESALTGGTLTADFEEAKFGNFQVLHDQHLMRHLEAKGLMANEWVAARTSPPLADLCVMATPLHPKEGLLNPPDLLTFERREGREYFSGARVPFWHMQSSFSMFCSFYFLCEPFLARNTARIPFPRPKAGRDNLSAMLCGYLRDAVIAGRAPDERMAALRPLMFRAGIYPRFFEGDLAERLFVERTWWRAGIFA